MDVMPIAHIPDWEMRLARQDAFWQGAILDRPVTSITVRSPNKDYPWPEPRQWPDAKARWMDLEWLADTAVANVRNTAYLGDALPHVYPNLGPEIFSAFLGSTLEFGESTSWSIPLIADWAEADAVGFHENNPYWHQINRMTERLLQVGRELFYTGITDLHPGADAIAAFRDPQQMNIDMLESPDAIDGLLARVNQAFFDIYDRSCDRLMAAGQAISSWPGIVSRQRWYVPSNDFSCMISKSMFDRHFLPGIAAECEHLEASLYHLDGPNALRHLDSLLQIDALNAVQWVYGDGNGRATDWLAVYQRCQAAGKGIQIRIEPDELPVIMEALRPEGVWLGINGVRSVDEGTALLNTVARWVD